MSSASRTLPARADTDSFRGAFRGYAAGVVVITADAGSGPAGFTATSLASVSLSPPLVSFALSSHASSWPTVAACGSVVVHFLTAEHRELAHRFATSGIDRFAAPLEWRRLDTGEPLLTDAAGHLRARVERRLAAGDHHIVVARVIDLVPPGPVRPLLYHHGDYRTTAPIPRDPS